MEKEINIIVNNVKCRIESEVSRHAIKYRMVTKDEAPSIIIIEKRNDMRFANNAVVLVDIGGGIWLHLIHVVSNLRANVGILL